MTLPTKKGDDARNVIALLLACALARNLKLPAGKPYWQVRCAIAKVVL